MLMQAYSSAAKLVTNLTNPPAVTVLVFHINWALETAVELGSGHAGLLIRLF